MYSSEIDEGIMKKTRKLIFEQLHCILSKDELTLVDTLNLMILNQMLCNSGREPEVGW